MLSCVTRVKVGALRGLVWGLIALGALLPQAAGAVDLPTAAGSPIAGISFDDRPLMLPVQRNFQMAMLTASSELGRSCGRMEAYGWRLKNDEQQRVNQIFNNTVDRLRAQGFKVESKSLNSLSRDVTLYSADRPDKYLIFLWSAGEIGLAMVLCETSAPLPAIPQNILKNTEANQPATLPNPLPTAQALRSNLQAPTAASANAMPTQLTRTGKPVAGSFSPAGNWTGSYTCAQGTTGATLHIDHVKGDQFEGTFSFYPTTKNPYVPTGKYTVFGEYDADSLRILINPGKWVDRPKDYYSTIMIGSFDPVARTFSGYFQGITGCTSFEAKQSLSSDASVAETKAEKKASTKKAAPVKKAAKKTAAKPVIETQPVAVAPAATAPARASSIEPPAGIAVGTPTR